MESIDEGVLACFLCMTGSYMQTQAAASCFKLTAGYMIGKTMLEFKPSGARERGGLQGSPSGAD